MTTDTTAVVPDVGELERNWIAFAKHVDALLSEFVSVHKENEALRKRLEAADALADALAGLKRIFEEVEGAMAHGTFRSEKSNLRVKDTPEWVAAYLALAAHREAQP